MEFLASNSVKIVTTLVVLLGTYTNQVKVEVVKTESTQGSSSLLKNLL